jgi:glycosyltransferase involved in cell wall biosynthesis
MGSIKISSGRRLSNEEVQKIFAALSAKSDKLSEIQKNLAANSFLASGASDAFGFCMLSDILSDWSMFDHMIQMFEAQREEFYCNKECLGKVIHALINKNQILSATSVADDEIFNLMSYIERYVRYGGESALLIRAAFNCLIRVEKFECARKAISLWLKLARNDYADILRAAHEMLARSALEPYQQLQGEELNDIDPRLVAQILVMIGVNHGASTRPIHAQMCFSMARLFDPTNLAASFNLGYLEFSDGNISAAAVHFAGLHRVYVEHARHCLFPQHKGLRWPFGDFGVRAAFDMLLPKDKEWPAITIVTPSYNQAQYIEETIYSVLAQEYPNLQYIIIDGGSSDGSVEVIKKYSSRIDKVIIEPDNGQSHAINKGMALARGELLGWLNSDDMLAPGALFAMALCYLETDADLIAGSCIATRNGAIELITRPSIEPSEFNVRTLSDVFGRWLRGHFFYQPEALFSRRMWAKVGGALNEDNHMTMDYELWMKFAKAGASFEVISWPCAIFRHHSAQKTNDLDATIFDQLQYVEPDHVPSPGLARNSLIDDCIKALASVERPRILAISSRASKIFSFRATQDIRGYFDERGMDVDFTDDVPEESIVGYDAVIYLAHLQNDPLRIGMLRERGFSNLLVGWFWDNHHHPMANNDVAECLDIAIPGHDFARSCLSSRNSRLAAPVPLCVTQWTRQEAAELYQKYGQQERSDRLYGGFVKYRMGVDRQRLVEDLQERIEEHALSLLDERTMSSGYFGKDSASRFREWASYKCSLILPLRKDLSQRFFDALLAGQVPVVSDDILDLGSVLSKAMLRQLPIVSFKAGSADSALKAWQRAIKLFDEGGQEAAMARHQYALNNHMFEHRLEQILQAVAGKG